MQSRKISTYGEHTMKMAKKGETLAKWSRTTNIQDREGALKISLFHHHPHHHIQREKNLIEINVLAEIVTLPIRYN